MKRFLTGFRSLFVGLRLIRTESSILRLAILPFAIDFIALVGIFVWGSGRIPGWVDRLMKWSLPDMSGFWSGLVYYPALLLAWLIFLAMLFFLGYILASIVASPFNSLLAEKTLEHLGALRPEKFSFSRWLSVSARMFGAALLKSLLFVCLGLVFFGVSFVPLLGAVASIGILMIMAFDSADYSFEALRFNLPRRLRFFRENWVYFLGSAAALGLTLWIPGLNFLLFPAAVVGQAELVQKILKER